MNVIEHVECGCGALMDGTVNMDSSLRIGIGINITLDSLDTGTTKKKNTELVFRD